MFQKNGRFYDVRLLISATRFFVAVVWVLSVGSTSVWAAENCRPVHGRFQSTIDDLGGRCPVFFPLFCTKGKVIGGLQGQFELTLTSQIPAHLLIPVDLTPLQRTVPTVIFFPGLSDIRMKHGGRVFGTDTGALDTDPLGDGHFASLITFTGGDGNFTGASGHIVLDANADLAVGTVSGDYTGEICVP